MTCTVLLLVIMSVLPSVQSHLQGDYRIMSHYLLLSCRITHYLHELNLGNIYLSLQVISHLLRFKKDEGISSSYVDKNYGYFPLYGTRKISMRNLVHSNQVHIHRYEEVAKLMRKYPTCTPHYPQRGRAF